MQRMQDPARYSRNFHGPHPNLRGKTLEKKQRKEGQGETFGDGGVGICSSQLKRTSACTCAVVNQSERDRVMGTVGKDFSLAN